MGPNDGMLYLLWIRVVQGRMRGTLSYQFFVELRFRYVLWTYLPCTYVGKPPAPGSPADAVQKGLLSSQSHLVVTACIYSITKNIPQCHQKYRFYHLNMRHQKHNFVSPKIIYLFNKK